MQVGLPVNSKITSAPPDFASLTFQQATACTSSWKARPSHIKKRPLVSSMMIQFPHWKLISRRRTSGMVLLCNLYIGIPMLYPSTAAIPTASASPNWYMIPPNEQPCLSLRGRYNQLLSLLFPWRWRPRSNDQPNAHIQLGNVGVNHSC